MRVLGCFWGRLGRGLFWWVVFRLLVSDDFLLIIYARMALVGLVLADKICWEMSAGGRWTLAEGDLLLKAATTAGIANKMAAGTCGKNAGLVVQKVPCVQRASFLCPACFRAPLPDVIKSALSPFSSFLFRHMSLYKNSCYAYVIGSFRFPNSRSPSPLAPVMVCAPVPAAEVSTQPCYSTYLLGSSAWARPQRWFAIAPNPPLGSLPSSSHVPSSIRRPRQIPVRHPFHLSPHQSYLGPMQSHTRPKM